MGSKSLMMHYLGDFALFVTLNFFIVNIFLFRNMQASGAYYFDCVLLCTLLGISFWHIWRKIPESLYFLYALIINLVFAGMLIPCMW